MSVDVAAVLERLTPEEIAALREHFVVEHVSREARLARIDQRIKELEKTRRRVLAKERRMSRFAPYGYTLTEEGEVVEDPAEQRAVALILQLHGAKKSLRQIARALEEAGHQPRDRYGRRRAGGWHPNTVRRILLANRQPAVGDAP